MGDLLGKYFVEQSLPPSKKQYIEKILEYIKQTMINRIPKVEWLDDETIEYAIKKVEAMDSYVGYTESSINLDTFMKNYGNLTLSDNDYFNNVINIFENNNNNDLKYITSTKEDLEETQLPPQMLNAAYASIFNSITITSGILHSPFFSYGVPDYINYGSMGSVVGHELTHAFDNSGRNYDMNGNINDWWTKNDADEYNEKTTCFAKQYSEFFVEDNEGKKHYVDGNITLNENIADNGGIHRAFESWQLSLMEDPETVKKAIQQLPGLTKYTPEQLFFISYGQVWCENVLNTKDMLSLHFSDEHAPGFARVNGVISNSKLFAKTFNCPANSKMNPEKKCELW
ncbi:hypothetical protein PIROE2DRAFT_15296 [Piromyces sp. E2]|nr:hypothetical protein PIROE2DRAFT_15296 [Piromyces sp. E2]|eukprot:OUM59231.1 hypothetical protein PIROE2DRAFT_15296 [Piromyces sp. E2]